MDVMELFTEQYQPSVHDLQLSSWFEQWNIATNITDLLPKTGFIVDGVCAIFLYETNSKVCFIDGFISNKLASEEVKEKALDQVVLAAIDQAKADGFKKIVAQTRIAKVIERAEHFGFQPLGPFSIMTKDL